MGANIRGTSPKLFDIRLERVSPTKEPPVIEPLLLDVGSMLFGRCRFIVADPVVGRGGSEMGGLESVAFFESVGAEFDPPRPKYCPFI